MTMRNLTLYLSMLVLCLVSGCRRDSRLLGKWTFDRPTTEAHLSKTPTLDDAKRDILGTMKKALASSLVPTLIEKLDGSTLTITEKEMIFTGKNGSGKVEAYEVIERPAKDTWRVKTSENKVETWSREGDQLSSPAMGDVELTVYFRRAK